MTAKTITGAQFKDFYQNHWPGQPGEVWHEDSEYEIENEYGTWILPLDAKLEVSKLGYLQWGLTKECRSFEDVWTEFCAANRGDRILTLRVPAGKLEALQEALAALEISPIEDQLDVGDVPSEDGQTNDPEDGYGIPTA